MSQLRIASPQDAITVDVDPDAGGRIAQITFHGTRLLVDRTDETSGPLAWGAYPMVPWAGRIRNGRFEFGGVTYQLPRNHGEHAMHGVGFTSPWSVVEHEPALIRLLLEMPNDERWPFGGHAAHTIEVDDHRVTCSIRVTAADQAFPVSFGWHPWFRKPDRLDFRPTAMYRRDDRHIAVDELVEVPPGPWDDCFINREPVALTIDGVDVVLTSPCDHWVVYDEPGHATCVEPQTGPPDAFNIAPRVLQPDESFSASFRLRLGNA